MTDTQEDSILKLHTAILEYAEECWNQTLVDTQVSKILKKVDAYILTQTGVD